jgi:hypothetical protein
MVDPAVTVRTAVVPLPPGVTLADDNEQVTFGEADEHARLTGAAKAPYCGTMLMVNVVD